MKNADIIRIFFDSPRECMCNNLRIEKREGTWILTNYFTDLVKYDTSTDRYTFNATKYSVSTRKIQSEIRWQLPLLRTTIFYDCDIGFKFYVHQ